MVIEYAGPQEETGVMLKTLTGALLLQIARRYKVVSPADKNLTVAEQIIKYMGEHMEDISLPAI